MNVHKLTPPRDCPKCGYVGAFRGPRFWELLGSYPLPRRMQWDCKVCGFEKVTAPLDEAERDEHLGGG